MTAVTSNDCTTITITSTNLVADNISATLKITHNKTDEYTLTLSPSTVGTYTFAADDLDQDSLAEGIYSIILTTVDVAHTERVESACVALICSLKCDILDYYADSSEIEKVLAYEALKLSSDCVSCSCDLMQDFYNVITHTTDVSNCNCQ